MKKRVPLKNGASRDGTPRPGLPATQNDYIFKTMVGTLGNDPPQVNTSFRVDVIRKQCLPDLPKQSGKNLSPDPNKKIRPVVGSRAVK